MGDRADLEESFLGFQSMGSHIEKGPPGKINRSQLSEGSAGL